MSSQPQPQRPDSANGQPQDRSPTVIPQDKTGSAHALAFGLTFPDMMFIAIPTIVLFLIAVKGFHLPPSKYLIGGLIVVAFSLFSVVSLTDWYLTPTEFVARGITHIRERIRMPLVGEAAREVPGIVDTHPDADAVEERDGTLVGYVQVYLTNTSLDDDPTISQEILRLTTGINSKLGRAEGNGFDIKICIKQIPGSASRHVRGLEEATVRPNTPGIAQQYAAEQAAHLKSELDERGVMDRVITIAVPVAPDDINLSGGYLDKLSGSSFVRPSQDQYAAQKSLLKTRISAVEQAIGQATHTRQLDMDEVISLYREYWLDEHEPLSYTNIATDTPPLVDPELRAAVNDAATSGMNAASVGRADGGTTTAENRESAHTPEDGSRPSSNQPETEPSSPSSPRSEPGFESESESETGDGGIRSQLDSILHSIGGSRVVAGHAGREQAIYSPSYLDVYTKGVELNDQFTSTVWVTGWPSLPHPELLSSILAIPNVRYDMSIYLHARDYREKLDEIEDERQTTTSISLEHLGGVDDGDDAAVLAGDMGQLRDGMRDEDLECFEVSVAITVRANTKEELQGARREISSRASSHDISIDACHSRQREGLISTSPSSVDAFEDAVHVDTQFDLASDSVAHLYPFGGYYRADADGCTYGVVRTIDANEDSIGVLQVDRRSLAAGHCCWIGRTGSGKTFDCQSHTIEELSRYPDRKAVVVDVKNGGFDGLIEAFDGTKVVVGDTIINPFEIRPPSETGGAVTPLEEVIRLLLDMFEIYLMNQGPDDDAQQVRSTNSMVIRKLYDDFGITPDPKTHDPTNREKSDRNPIMEDYFGVLEEAENHPERFTKRDSDLGKEALLEDIKILVNRLKEFDTKGSYSFLCGESEVDLYDRVVYFDMHHYKRDDSAIKGMMLSMITAHAHRMIDQGEVNVVVDEAHDMFADAGRAGKIETMVRQGREAGLLFDFITQSDADFQEGAAKIIADQSPIKVWRDLGDGDRVSPTDFGLTQSQARLVSGGLVSGDIDAADHSDAVVDIDGDKYLVEKRVSEYAQRLIEYKEVEHGDFGSYMANAGFGSMTPTASANDEVTAGQGPGAGPQRRSGFDRDEYVKDLLEQESSVYGGAPHGETARVYTGDDEPRVSETPETDSENPSPVEADTATDPTADTEHAEGKRGGSTDPDDARQPPETGLVGRAKVLLTTPITKLGDPRAGDSLFGDAPKFEAEYEPALADIPALTPDEETALRKAGFETPLDVWQADHETLTETAGISTEHADTISQRVAGIIDPADIPHHQLAVPEPDADTGTESPTESSHEQHTASEERVTEDETKGRKIDKSDTGTTSEEATDTGLIGRAKAAIVTGGAFQSSAGESDPYPDLELIDIPPIMGDRAAILADAGFNSPRDVWEADQEALGRLDKFDDGLAETVHREAGLLVDPDSFSSYPPDSAKSPNSVEPSPTDRPASGTESTTPAETPDSTSNPEHLSSDDANTQETPESTTEVEPEAETDRPEGSPAGDIPTDGDLRTIDGIADNRAQALSEVGIESPTALAAADISAITEANGIGPKRAEQYRGNCRAMLGTATNDDETGPSHHETDQDTPNRNENTSTREADQ